MTLMRIKTPQKTKHMKRKLIIVLFLLSACGRMHELRAQQDSLEMDVTFTGSMELFLKNSNKLSSWPQLRESVVELPSIKYTLLPFKHDVEIEPRKIEAAKVNIEDRLSKLYRGYIRGGFGLYTTALLDAYYMDERSRNGSWGVEFKHLSSAGGVALEDSIPDQFSENSAHLWGRRFLKKHAIEGDLKWRRQVAHAYGFDPYLFWDANSSEDALRQRFNKVAGSIALESYYRDSSKVNYRGDIRFRNYSDQVDGVENNVDVSGHARKHIGSELYKLHFGVNYNEFKFQELLSGEDQTKSNVLLQIRPMVTTHAGQLTVNVGAGIWLDARGSQPFHFYPLAEASYSLLDDLFVPYAGIGGQMELNTYASVTGDNPFALSDIELRNTNRKIEAYGGIRGSLSSSTSFNARVSSTRYEDFLYFVNDSIGGAGNRFSTLYDNLSVFNLRGEVSVNTSDNFRLQARGDYFIYSEENELHAWYQPTTRVTLAATYDIENKLIASLEIFTEGKRKAKSLVQHQDGVLEDGGFYTVDLRGYADANLNVEYRYTQRLSVWLRLNNFLASRYQRWNMYPVQRFNAMMGASYSF